jgi:hypothetical protein
MNSGSLTGQEPTPPSPAESRQRRGLGVIFIIFGLLSCVLMSAAALYSQGGLRLQITAAAWQRMYIAHFICTAGCGAAYLWLGYRQTRRVPVGGYMYYAVGLLLYIGLFLLAGLLLVTRRVPSWFSLSPGLLLTYYGGVLLRGRPLLLPSGR